MYALWCSSRSNTFLYIPFPRIIKSFARFSTSIFFSPFIFPIFSLSQRDLLDFLVWCIKLHAMYYKANQYATDLSVKIQTLSVYLATMDTFHNFQQRLETRKKIFQQDILPVARISEGSLLSSTPPHLLPTPPLPTQYRIWSRIFGHAENTKAKIVCASDRHKDSPVVFQVQFSTSFFFFVFFLVKFICWKCSFRYRQSYLHFIYHSSSNISNLDRFIHFLSKYKIWWEVLIWSQNDL